MRRHLLVPTAAVCILAAAPALAQSEADKAAARALAETGLGLMEKGQYAMALDKLQRAQSIFDAPTHLLYIAECDEKLDRYIDAAETYRKLARWPLSPKSPKAFTDAQKKGATEFAALQPRIPELLVGVKPEDAEDFEVKLDGAAMPSALIGQSRPIDPGTHAVQVSAKGYVTEEQTVTLDKGEKQLRIALRQGEGASVLAAVPPDARSKSPKPKDGGGKLSAAKDANDDGPHGPGWHEHDGFFLRLGGGWASLSKSDVSLTQSVAGSSVTQTFSESGSGSAFEITIGGTIAEGLVIGGTGLGYSISSPTANIDVGGTTVSGTEKGDFTLGLVGASVVYFPKPTGNLDFGGLVGYGTRSIKKEDMASASGAQPKDDFRASGLAVSAHVAYSFWVSDNWSLGGQFRLTYAHLVPQSSLTYTTSAGDVSVDMSGHDDVVLPSLSLVGTYN